jgi:aminopeptidase-like protein
MDISPAKSALHISVGIYPRNDWIIGLLESPSRLFKAPRESGLQHSLCGRRRTSFLPSRDKDALSNRVAKHILLHRAGLHTYYTFLDRGGDERQYCAPGVDLPIATVMRSKYGTYPEYHTSDDNTSFVTPKGLQGGYEVIRDCLEALELNRSYVATCVGEPQMGKRGLYSNLGTRTQEEVVKLRMHLLAYADGKHSLLDVAERLGVA